MNDAWLGRLFVRFREKRDGKALAAVFDATARELIGVAAHLVPRLDQAEDVVQTTFVRAIEHAERFDASRSLKAWLYGILWREAAKLQRVERRRPLDAEAPPSTREPAEDAAGHELEASVRRALERVPSPYREVLEPVLREERSTSEIAAELARSPGTVRVQLQRGLERLRLELGAARRVPEERRAHGLFAIGLATMRARLLAEHGIAAGAVPASSALFLALQWLSVALTPPVLVAGTALVAATGVGIAGLREATVPQAREPVPELASEPVGTSEEALVAPPARPDSDAPSATPERRDAARPARGTRATVPRPAPDAPQVTGVVVDSAGRVLAGVLVVAEAENHYGYESTTTGSDGRFAFAALATGRWYFQAEDERYARMWWQDHSVGIEEDDGEIFEADLRLVLYPPHRVEGVVIDASGMAVPEVSVTLAAEWPEGQKGYRGDFTQEIAVTSSDDAGGFVLDRLSPGRVMVVLDHPGFARTMADFTVPGAPRLVIESGMTLAGQVVHDGVPLPDVLVEAHSTRNSRLTLGDWQVRTDPEGRFRIEHVHSRGESRFDGVSTLGLQIEDERWASDWYYVFESAARTLPFVLVEAFEKNAEKPGSIDVGRDLAAEARAQGKPFGSGAIRVRVEPARADLESVDVWLSGLSPELSSVIESGKVAAEEACTFEHLAPGKYRVSARNQGDPNYAPESVELGTSEALEVVLRPGTLALRGRTLCAGRPVTTASVFARSIRGGAGQQARGTREDDGYEIRGLVPGSYELLVEDDGALVQYFEVRLEADAWLDLELPPGRIEGRLAGLDLSDLGEGFRVMVFPFGWYQEAGNRGVIVEPDAEGRFAAKNLSPGDYGVWTWRGKGLVPPRIVTITAGQPVQEVVLAPAAERGTLAGRVAGSISRDSRRPTSIAVLRREPQGLFRTAYCSVDPEGNFAEEVEPGRYALLVSNFGGSAPFFFVPEVAVSAGEKTALELVSPPGRAVSIRLDAGGAWTPRSIWRLRMGGEWISFLLLIGSQAEGRRAGSGPFQLPPGRYAVEADFGDAAPLVREFEVVPGDGVQEVVVTRP